MRRILQSHADRAHIKEQIAHLKIDMNNRLRQRTHKKPVSRKYLQNRIVDAVTSLPVPQARLALVHSLRFLCLAARPLHNLVPTPRCPATSANHWGETGGTLASME